MGLFFYLSKTGEDERERVDRKSDKKIHNTEGVQPKNCCPTHKFFYVILSVTCNLIFSAWILMKL